MRRVPGSRHYRGYMPAYASPGKRRLSLQAVLITWPLIALTDGCVYRKSDSAILAMKAAEDRL